MALLQPPTGLPPPLVPNTLTSFTPKSLARLPTGNGYMSAPQEVTVIVAVMALFNACVLKSETFTL